LLFTTSRPVNDPVVRLAVQAGCEGTVRRDYALLLDPPAASGASAAVTPRVAGPVAAASASVQRETVPKARVPTQLALAPTVAPSRAETLSSTPVADAARQPKSLLSSPGGSSFIPEASAAGLPHSASSPGGLALADVEPQVAPWWPLAAALLVVAGLARWLVPMRRRSAATPAWVAPTARTEPNPSVSRGASSKTLGKSGHFAAMTEPGTGFPRGASKTGRAAPRTEPVATRPQPPAKTVAMAEDPRFAEFDADLIEEQTIRAEWAKLVNDGAVDMGGDSILKAIDDAERALHGGPAHPAQVALDRSLDDELLPNRATRR
jgi:hypothetical protein